MERLRTNSACDGTAALRCEGTADAAVCGGLSGITQPRLQRLSGNPWCPCCVLSRSTHAGKPALGSPSVDALQPIGALAMRISWQAEPDPERY